MVFHIKNLHARCVHSLLHMHAFFLEFLKLQNADLKKIKKGLHETRAPNRFLVIPVTSSVGVLVD
jgi:hypothetical protein